MYNTNRELLVILNHGSKLYGTDTPDSDTDYRSVVLPSVKDILLGNTNFHYTANSNSGKNTKDDFDHTIYSLQNYVQRLCRCDQIALEMFYTDTEKANPLWTKLLTHTDKVSASYKKDALINLIDKFKNIKDDISKLSALVKVLSGNDDKLYAIQGALIVDGKNFKFLKVDNDLYYSVRGKQYNLNLKASSIVDSVQSTLDHLKRRMATHSRTLDVKLFTTTSHTLRIGYQHLARLRTGRMVFPLPEAQFLKELKAGFISDEDLVSAVEALIADIDEFIPMPIVDHSKFWDDFVADAHYKLIRGF